MFYFNQSILLAGSNRTGITTADASHGEEQETYRSGGLYRCVAVACDRMFSAITSKSISEAIIISWKSVN